MPFPLWRSLLTGLLLAPCCLQAEAGSFEYKTAVLGNNANPNVQWDAANLAAIRKLGFNTIQLNLAWGWRPNDEPLNIEDVIDLPADLQKKLPQVVPLRSDQSPARRAQRRTDLHRRIQLCHVAGLRTIFHFGAPYNAHERYGDGPPNCLMDPKLTERYVALLKAFAAEYPGVDDILVYTYDQDAWLCSEFGPCESCRGIPLHERLPPFLQALAKTWSQASSGGRLWWEPWELSAGQVYKCVEQFDGHGFGLALHCNIAEVMSTQPVDRWLKNVCTLARVRKIPVIVEYNLGGPSEELEPFRYAQHPLVTWRGLKAIAAVPGVAGIKEYYGLEPQKEDPNLRMTSIFFKHPRWDEAAALNELAKPYEVAAPDMEKFWTLTSEGMEFFPWDASWFFRYVGQTTPVHSMNAAFIRGQVAHTPAWESARRGVFMKTDNNECDPWMLEDVQLRCDMASQRMEAALQVGRKIQGAVPKKFSDEFAHALDELNEFRRRAVGYVCHLRETNLATTMRLCVAQGEPIPERLPQEMAAVLKTDQANQQQAEPVGAALALLAKDRGAFLKTYFLVPDKPLNQGGFNVTSRW